MRQQASAAGEIDQVVQLGYGEQAGRMATTPLPRLVQASRSRANNQQAHRSRLSSAIDVFKVQSATTENALIRQKGPPDGAWAIGVVNANRSVFSSPGLTKE
jgi:hypothetical protein